MPLVAAGTTTLLDTRAAQGFTTLQVSVLPFVHLPVQSGSDRILLAELSLLGQLHQIPELLLYEPEKNGKLRFVGVEYIVPFTDIPSTAPAPTLLGQRFAQVPEFQVWGLHIWVGRHNPSGIFAPWNPKVSCDNAPASQRATMAHHHGN